MEFGRTRNHLNIAVLQDLLGHVPIAIAALQRPQKTVGMDFLE